MNQENNDSKICPVCGRPTHKESKYCIFHASAEEKTKRDFKRKLKEHVKRIKEDGDDYNFEKFIFVGDIDFKKDLNVIIFKNANFKSATFKGDAVFEGATFKGKADFKEVTFKGEAVFFKCTFKGKAFFDKATFEGRASLRWATFEGDTILDFTTFKGEADLMSATFKGNADLNVATFMGVVNLGGAIFEGYAHLNGATFKGEADLRWATFEGDVDLKWATFEGDTILDFTTFKVDAELNGATFKGNAGLFRATFKGDTSLIKATFEGDADLRWATFKGNADLNDVTFKGEADLGGATFEGYTHLNGATFKGKAVLSETTFKGDTSLIRATFKKKADFSYSKFLSTYKFEDICFEGDIFFDNSIFSTRNDLNLKVIGKGLVSLKHTFIENIFLELDLAKDIQIDFSDSLLRNTRIEKDKIENRIIQEKENKYSEAKKIYLILKNNFHSLGQYDDESWAFQKEKEMERKTYYFNAFTKNTESKEKKNKKKDQKVKKPKAISYFNWMKIKEFGKWIWSGFCNMIYGYGERPLNVIISAGVIMVFFALLFSSIGLSNPEIIDLKGITIDQNTGNIVDSASKGLLRNNVIRNIPDSLYFSLTTFTTLGYGDLRPLEGWGRILAGSEALIGAFMMALFVYTFARRTGGR